MSENLPSAGMAVPAYHAYKPLEQSEVTVVRDSAYHSYGSNVPMQTAVPLPPPPREYYGSWRDEPVQVVHRDDADLWCSLFIVFFFFLSFLLLIVVVSIEYSDDDYY
jgi:hypothetical protein